jgi:predicted nucleic acid-binding protein
MSQLTNEKAAERFSELVDAPIATHAVEPHLEQALRLATEIGHPNCDCFYLALALALLHRTPVIAADRRFASAAKLTFLADRVRLLSA